MRHTTPPLRPRATKDGLDLCSAAGGQKKGNGAASSRDQPVISIFFLPIPPFRYLPLPFISQTSTNSQDLLFAHHRHMRIFFSFSILPFPVTAALVRLTPQTSPYQNYQSLVGLKSKNCSRNHFVSELAKGSGFTPILEPGCSFPSPR